MPTIMVPVILPNGTHAFVEAEVSETAPVPRPATRSGAIASSGAVQGPISTPGEMAAQTLKGISDTIEGFALEFAGLWAAVRPSELSIDLSLSAKYDAGVLLGALVRGSAEANVKVSLKWTGAESPPAISPAVGDVSKTPG